MPHLVAGIEEVPLVASRDQPVLGIDVRQVRDLREVPRLTGDGADGGLERTEALAERNLLGIGERLTPEEQHRVIVERAGDLAKHGVVDPSNVDAGDLHAER